MTNSKNTSRRTFIQQLGALGLAGAGGGTLLAACGGGSASGSGGNAQTAADGEVKITPVGNQMKYEKTSFTVRPGQEVHIVFENTATSPAMHHNVVVLNTNDDAVVKQIGQAGAKAGKAANYIPENDAIIAHTPMSKPGETVEVTFTAPEETGDYTYVCTFPGHWATMQGTMHVKAASA